jgi:photosystem II stability/assembly factor-like uncharacterized protein
MRKIYSRLFLSVIPVLLAACQPATPAPTATAEPTAPSTKNTEPWQQLLSLPAPPLIQLAAFYDESYGITVADDSRELYTEDGGATWQNSKISAGQLFGLDIVDRNTAWACGNVAVRVTTDGAKTWQAAADFAATKPEHCRFISFLDTRTGWAATTLKLVTTGDGAATWTEASLPDGVDRIAALSLFTPGNGYLLAQTGDLFRTADGGQSWESAGTLPLAGLAIAEKTPPVAAMRFTDADHGIIIVPAAGGGSSQVTAFHTSDGGATWSRETVTDVFGFPVISHDGRILTLYTITSKILVYQYNGG